MTEPLEHVKQVGAAAGYKCHHIGPLAVVRLNLGGGRRRDVFIGDGGDGPKGMRMINFFTPCQEFPGGAQVAMSKEQAVDLLQRTSVMPFTAFCLVDSGRHHMLCVKRTHSVQGLTPQDFEVTCELLARFADRYVRQREAAVS